LQSLGGVLWIARGGLLVAVVLHVLMAVQLGQRKRAARPVAYAKLEPQVSTFASRTIRWGGFTILAFTVFHILHFTTLNIFPEYREIDVYSRMIVAFRTPWITAVYVIAMIAIGLHLYHGTWSSFRTLGLVRASTNPLRRTLAAGLAIIVALGFIVVPVAIALGIVKPVTTQAAPAAESATVAAPQR
jgi:succinate dehydrogenase / fumarate reductase cytochrome b subunit